MRRVALNPIAQLQTTFLKTALTIDINEKILRIGRHQYPPPLHLSRVAGAMIEPSGEPSAGAG
jgi:hypothetical protein